MLCPHRQALQRISLVDPCGSHSSITLSARSEHAFTRLCFLLMSGYHSVVAPISLFTLSDTHLVVLSAYHTPMSSPHCSFFMDVKCPGCFNITTVFSHAQVGMASSCLPQANATVLSLHDTAIAIRLYHS
jgi:Ribosomal protein S27